MAGLERLVPEAGDYLHAEGNSDAHIKASLMGSSLNLVIKGGQVLLGTWQGVFFCEFDGPRSRKVWVSVLGV
jgi:secondary thiamine-phosphate synthase enzyme